jgi:hypothetical protein
VPPIPLPGTRLVGGLTAGTMAMFWVGEELEMARAILFCTAAAMMAFCPLVMAQAAAAGKKTGTIDACTLVTLAEVKALFPDADHTESSSPMKDSGISDCGFKDKDDTRVVNVRVRTNAAPTEDMEIMEWSLSDPGGPPNPAVKHEAVAGLGGEAAAIVVRRDKTIKRDVGILALQHGPDVVVVTTGEIQGKDKARVIKELSQLAKLAAGRF